VSTLPLVCIPKRLVDDPLIGKIGKIDYSGATGPIVEVYQFVDKQKLIVLMDGRRPFQAYDSYVEIVETSPEHQKAEI
jgi:hypothetical protein